MIYVGILDAKGINPDSSETQKQLPKKVLERIEKAKNENEKKLRAGAYILLRELYKTVTEDENMPEIFYTPEGKPQFDDKFEWQFSISHDDDVAAVALSCGRKKLGVDIQSMPNGRVKPERVEKRFLARIKNLETKIRGKNENSKKEVAFKTLFFESVENKIEKATEGEFLSGVITEGSPSVDFLLKWTLLEAALKMSGGGFRDMSVSEELIEGACIHSLTFIKNGKTYALTVTQEKSEP